MTPAPDSPAAYTLVDKVRTTVHAIPGAHAEVGGGTAIQKDVESAATHDRNLLIPLILVVVFVILGLLLRALVAPLVLIATVVLSFGSALGISALFFKHVFGFAGADTGMPLFVFVFLVALGIDYNIFLMTRVREESIRTGTRRGALTGLAATGGVITSAGLVLAGTFASLSTLPLVEFTEIGFTVALGVLLDSRRAPIIDGPTPLADRSAVERDGPRSAPLCGPCRVSGPISAESISSASAQVM